MHQVRGVHIERAPSFIPLLSRAAFSHYVTPFAPIGRWIERGGASQSADPGPKPSRRHLDHATTGGVIHHRATQAG